MDYDTLMATVRSGMRADADGCEGSARSIPEVVVQVTAADLERRSGRGWLAGVLSPLTIGSIERMMCGSDLRLHVDGAAGEVLHHGKALRRFTSAQRRAIIVRAGGCQWPGCAAPPSWCDVHHAAWFRRDDGPTDVENGVLLCSFHHHLVHAEHCRRRIEVRDSIPYLDAKTWRGDPDPQHRMGMHPSERNSPPRSGTARPPHRRE